MIDPDTIQTAGRLLNEAAGRPRVVLFGSCARGDADEDSDLDFLVIEPLVTSRAQEMARLRQVLRPLRIAVDVLVCSAEEMAERKDLPYGVIHWAMQEGVTVHDTLE